MTTLKDFKPLFERARVLMWVYLILVFLLKIFGFEIISTGVSNSTFIQFINETPALRVAIKTILGVGVTNLMYYCVIEDYTKNRIVKSNILFVIFFLIQNIVLELSVLQYLFMFISPIIHFVPILYKVPLKRCIRLVSLDLFYQIISFIVRDYDIFSIDLDFSTVTIFMLDYYIMWSIYSLNKKVGELEWLYSVGVYSYLKKKLRNLIMKLKNLQNCMVKQRQNLRKTFTNLNLTTLCVSVKCYAKILLRVYLKTKIIPPLVFALVYLGYAYLVDKVLESILLFIAYGTFRYLYPKKFHADYIPNIKAQWISFTCVLLSCLTLCLALENTLIAELSILSSIVVAFVVDWLLYVVREHFDTIKDKPLFEKLLKLFTPREQLKSKLEEKEFKELHIKISVLYIIDKMTMEQVSKEVGYSLQTCKNYWGEVVKVFPELKKNKKINK